MNKLRLLLGRKQPTGTLQDAAISKKYLACVSIKCPGDSYATIPDYINNVDVLSESRETRDSTVELLRENSQTPKFCENKFRPHALPIVASLKGIRTIPKEDELFDIC